MSALQFLNKKSWHVSTIRNAEKVWLKEQEAAKEEKRIQQLQKQLEEERKLEDIQRIEAAAGRLSEGDALKARRLNWMYEFEPSQKKTEEQQEEEAERALEGKEVVDGSGEKDVESKLALVDAEAKLREDPLFWMKKRESVAELKRRKGAGIVRYEGKHPRPSKSEEARRKAEKEAKCQRKEERRKIREQREARRRERQHRDHMTAHYRTRCPRRHSYGPRRHEDYRPDDEKYGGRSVEDTRRGYETRRRKYY